MDPLTAIAASGLRARMESLELLANNVANVSTGGYKADREFYSLYAGEEAQDNDPVSTMPVIDRPYTDFSQGLLEVTGNPLDVALSGAGFFTVEGPQGNLYTRNGSFRLSAKGRLVTPDGYPVRALNKVPLQLDGSRAIAISAERSNGAAVTRRSKSAGRSRAESMSRMAPNSKPIGIIQPAPYDVAKASARRAARAARPVSRNARLSRRSNGASGIAITGAKCARRLTVSGKSSAR